MSIRKLVEGDCGGVNPLMQLGAQFTRDVAHRDEGLVTAQYEQSIQQDQRMVNEFLGQINSQPSSFRMNTLLQEMREIEQVHAVPLQSAPKVIDQVASGIPQMVHVHPQPVTTVNEFFNEADPIALAMHQTAMPTFMQPPMMHSFIPPVSYIQPNINVTPSISGEQFFAEAAAIEQMSTEESILDDANIEYNADATKNYNEKFWQRLQDEWSKLSEETDHPWLSELDENYDPYKDYEYVLDNPMSDISDAFSQGEEYMKRGDIPSAVLCFEVATQNQPDNAKAWEMLGISQAENEMDPQAIAALKRALDLQPDNKSVLMALSVCYTNESLQSHALNMLVRWLDAHPNYKHLVDQHPKLREISGPSYSSIVPSSRLQQLLEVYQTAAQSQTNNIDAKLQEALGVLYNLTADFEKAADSFRAALSVDGENAKTWNRLGASLANGSRSAEAVQAYQRALSLKPGFIRVRYNVGVCCMNLKAYTQAAEHLLTALNMQANAADKREFTMDEKIASSIDHQQQMSSSIWSTLKMVLSLLGRNDLQGFANERNLTELNKAFNIQLL